MSSFADKIRETWTDNLLFSVLLELTYSCNLDCSFCYNEKDLSGQLLSLNQYERLLADLRQMNVMNLVLSGGEPLAHPDFFQIGATARALGFAVRIKSNGHALNTTTARRIRDEIDPFEFDISLHGASAGTHDRQTGVPGSFQRLMKNLATLGELGLRYRLNSVLTQWNQHELTAMRALAKQLGARLQFDTHLSPRDNGDTSPLQLAADEQGLRELVTTKSAPAQVAKKGSSGKYCGAGASTLTIDPFGTVYPCVQWRKPVGNLHQSCIQDIWNNNQKLEAIRATNQETGRLTDAETWRQAGFCPGLAEKQTGNVASLYPSVVLQAKLRNDSQNPGALQ